MSINPESVGIQRYPLKSRGSLAYSTIFDNRVQENNWEAKSQDILNQE
jgi:hypothetical protein